MRHAMQFARLLPTRPVVFLGQVLIPLLYVSGCVTGLFGGMVVAGGMLGISPAAYLDRTLYALDWSHLGLGFAKALVFGAMIGMVGSYFGLHAQRNAAGVGVATT